MPEQPFNLRRPWAEPPPNDPRNRVYLDDQWSRYELPAGPTDRGRFEFFVDVLVKEHGVVVEEDAGRAFVRAADAWVFPRAFEYLRRYRDVPSGATLVSAPLTAEARSLIARRRKMVVEWLAKEGGAATRNDLTRAFQWGARPRAEVLKSLLDEGVIRLETVPSPTRSTTVIRLLQSPAVERTLFATAGKENG